MFKRFFILVSLMIIFGKIYATTWDEPWADDVIKGSSSFVLAKIKSCDPEKGIKIQIIKTLGGEKLADSITITDFYLLKLCSTSGGEGVTFHTEVVDSCYLFIKINKQGKYCIATPTAGFDYVTEGNVTSTFRHSYHQALVPVATYEKTMTAIFNNYHHLHYDTGFIYSFVNEYLTKKPASFSKDEINVFFAQHVALECIYHLKIRIDENLIFPFLNDRTNFHNQVSAARALSACNTTTSKNELLNVISDTTIKPFVQVMCIWTLGELDSKDIKFQLEKIEPFASVKEVSFGGDIMDPRIALTFLQLKRL